MSATVYAYNLIKLFAFSKRISLLVALMYTTILLNAQNLNVPTKTGPLGTRVNVISGNLFLPRTDIMIPARYFPLNISFYYNSFLFDENHGFGNGWTFQYNICYKKDTVPGRRIILWGDGREDRYDSITGEGYKTPRGFYSKLSQYLPDKYVLTNPDSIQFIFDNPLHRKITRIQEPNGNYINFIYADTLLTSLVNSAGQAISFTYNSKGQLATVVDAIAIPFRTFTYTYDAIGNLVEVKDPLNGKYRYSYLVNGPLKAIFDRNNNKVDIIYSPDLTIREIIGCNKRLSFSYDTTSRSATVTEHLSAGNQVTNYKYMDLENLRWVTSVSGNCCGYNLAYEYDDQGNITRLTDANGKIYNYTYDASGNMLSMTDPLGHTNTYTYTSDFKKLSTYTDRNGNRYSFQYDTKGNLTQIIAPGNNIYTATYNSLGEITGSTDPRGNNYIYTYNAQGHPVKVIGPNGYSATLSYDARGNLLSFTNARGHQSLAEYDILGRLKKVIDPYNNLLQFGYDANDNLVSYTNKNNETSNYTYDASNRLVTIKRPTNKNSHFSYDAKGNIIAFKDPLGQELKFNYDNRSRLKEIKDPENNSAVYSYDANGNTTGIQLPNGQSLTYTYDDLNRLVAVRDEISNVVSYTYDKNGNITSITNGTGAMATAVYDSLNRVTRIIDPAGNATLYGYDKNNNITSVTDREGHTSTYTYDSSDRVKTYTDNNNNTITVGYDPIGNIIELTDQNNNITQYTYDSLNRRKRMIYPDGKFQEYGYDKEGNIISSRLTDGSTIVYTYDTLNRLITKTLPDGNIFTYGYDALNRVITATNGSGTVTFTYDALNRVTSETFDDRTTRYQYSISGRTQTTLYPDSTVVMKEFDTRGRLVKLLKDGLPIAEYTYNNANQVASKTFGNGVVTNLQYDFSNRLNSLITSGNIQHSLFTYDKERNKTAINRFNNSALSEQFTYDNGYRLTGYTRGASGSPQIQNTYSYDPAGNRTTAMLNGITTTYNVNNLNQLTSVNGTGFTFDDRGNITFDGTFYKTYDGENRLVKDSAAPSVVVVYSYDALGRKVVKSINGNVFKYSFSGAAVIEERDNSNSLLNRTVYSHYLSPVLNEKNGGKYYFHNNELMTIEALSNAQGRLVESYQYDVYGMPSRYDSLGNPLPGSLAGNKFGFTGQEFDSITNNYRFFYRNYSPQTGVFNQRDPIEYGDGMAMYQYVGNNPANGIDVWGLEIISYKLPETCPSPNSVDGLTASQEISDFANNGKFTWDLGKNVAEFFSDGMVSMDEAGKGSKMGPGGAAIDLTIKTVKNYEVQTNGNSTYNERVDANWDVVGSGGGLIAALGSVALGGPVGWGVGVGTGTLAVGDMVSSKLTGKNIREHTEAPIVSKFERNANDEAFWEWAEDHGVNDNIFRKGDVSYDFIKNIYEGDEKTRATFQTVWKKHEIMENNPYKIVSLPDCCGGYNYYKVYYDPITGEILLVIPIDPNEIIGPAGQPDSAWVSVKDRLPYTINFENDTAATAPAKYIRVTTPIEPKQDATTFELGSFGFNYQSFEIPTGNASWYQRLDCRDSMNLYVDVVAGYDPLKNEAFWEFQSIDPVTLLPSEEPLTGLLFLQDTTKPDYGKGFVNFSIKPRADAHTLDTIAARAFIVFDQNDTIPTNVHKNTIDALPPTSSITDLPDTSPDTEIVLHYTGHDDPNGSGLKHYSIYVSDNDGPPELFVANFTRTDTIFRGQAEHLYKFYISAVDTVDNIEALTFMDSIMILKGEQNICPGASTVFQSHMSGGVLQWQVDDGTGYVNISNGGVYSGVETAALALTAPPTNMYGLKYRCVKDGSTYSDEFILKFSMTWEGKVSNAWENPLNWSCNVLPDEYTDVIIESGKPIYPLISSHVIIRTLQMNPGTTGTVGNGFTLTIRK